MRREDFLVCSTAKKFKDTIHSHALCVVMLKDVVPMERKHLEAALMSEDSDTSGLYAWKLDNVRVNKPFPVKGKLSLWECNHEIEYLKVNVSAEENDRFFEKYFEPLMYHGDREEW